MGMENNRNIFSVLKLVWPLMLTAEVAKLRSYLSACRPAQAETVYDLKDWCYWLFASFLFPLSPYSTHSTYSTAFPCLFTFYLSGGAYGLKLILNFLQFPSNVKNKDLTLVFFYW